MTQKAFLVLMAFIALTGIINCVLIEPAFAYKDKAVHSSSESEGDSDCCFIHCSSCHQYLTSSAPALTHNISRLQDIIPAKSTLHYDSPAGSIFHPPLAF